MSNMNPDFRYYENQKLWHPRHLSLLERQTLRLIEPCLAELSSNAKVVDLGCGNGTLLQEISLRYPELKLYGLDISNTALQGVPDSIICHQCDLKDIPFEDNFFDLCISLDVAEHIFPDEIPNVIREVSRICKGRILIVSPFLESNAIKTICPACHTIFSPYYHHNRFDIERWQSIVSNNIDRSFSFVPLGNKKNYIPSELGSLLLSAGVSATHSHETICPQCKTHFSNNQSKNFSELSLIAGGFSAARRECFSWHYEEMGVFISEKSLSSHSETKKSLTVLKNKDGIFWHEFKESGQSTSSIQIKLVAESRYNLNFQNSNSLRPGADLFGQDTYFLKKQNIEWHPETGIIWQINNTDDSEGIANSNLRLILSPGLTQQDISLTLTCYVNQRCTLNIYQYNRESSSSDRLREYKLNGESCLQNIEFQVSQRDDVVTPFGLFIDFIASVEDSETNQPLLITLISLIENGSGRIEHPLHHGFNEWPIEVLPSQKYSLEIGSLDSQNYSFAHNVSLLYIYDNISFDMSSHIIADEKEPVRLDLPILGSLIETHNHHLSMNSSSRCLYKDLAHQLQTKLCRD